MQVKRRRAALEDEGDIAVNVVLEDATGDWVPYEAPTQPAAAAEQQQASAAPADAAEAPDGDQRADEPGMLPGASSDDSDSGYSSDDSDGGQANMQHGDRMLTDASGVTLLAVGADKRQGVYVVPYRQQGQRKWRLAIIGFRSMRFSDGDLMVGYSRGCLCARDAGADRHAAKEGQDRPGRPRAWLTGAAMCSCSQQLLQHLGGEASVLRVFGLTAAASDDCIVQRLRMRGAQHFAVRAGADFADWGIVDATGRCSSCASRQWICEHVQQLPDTAEVERPSPLSAARFESKLNAEFDVETGRRRLTCISRLQLPPDLEGDSDLLRCVTGE